MQAYEHIMAAMIKLSQQTNSKPLTLDQNLALMKKYGAYFTYPDSIRALVRLSTGSAFRQPPHMTDGAWMKFIVGPQLKAAENGYPLDKMHIPDGLELKAADGPTSLETAIEQNKELFQTPEGQAIFEHLKQDTRTDKLFQGHMATCYIDEPELDTTALESYSLYGVDTKAGLARFNQTGKIVPMSEFREAVSYTQQLTTLELFKKLREAYPDITFKQIQDAIFESYDANYPAPMMNAKQYAVPSEEEQDRILHALTTGDYEYYEKLKKALVEKGAFKDITDINKQVGNLIDEITHLGIEPKEKDDIERV